MSRQEWKNKVEEINEDLGKLRRKQLIKFSLSLIVLVTAASLVVFNPLSGVSDDRKITEIDQQINITKDGVYPVRPEVSPGDRVRFMNKLDSRVTLSFEGDKSDLILIPGGADSIKPETVTYYKISSDRDFRSMEGSINVQS